MESISYALGDIVQSNIYNTAYATHMLLSLFPDMPIAEQFDAYAKVVAGATRFRGKPEFGITETLISGRPVSVRDDIVLEMPFCKLLHFACDSGAERPSLLLFAPMSGHYATLLRETVKGLLPYFDVTITDWANAREVPLGEGAFDFHSYIDYCDAFIDVRKPDAVMAVCQPGPAVAAALALREQNGRENPRAAIFMGSPIDTRVAPTQVTELAQKQSLEWFEKTFVQKVPDNYPGGQRAVYPGRTQLMSFLMMNAGKHAEKYRKLVDNIVGRDDAAIAVHNGFYDEYLSVMDLTAEFYLETVRLVFQEHALPAGTLEHRGQRVDLAHVTKTAIMAVEGEKDDISGPGQTVALLALCRHLPSYRKKHLLIPGAGHYGIFSGSKYRENLASDIVPFVQGALSRAAAPVLRRPSRFRVLTAA